MSIVLDASIATVWALADEQDPLADTAMACLMEGSARVPALWWYEIRNVLVINERRKRITAAGSQEYLEILSLLPIVMDFGRDEDAILHLARRYQLTFYDATYLELAIRTSMPLATLDRALRTAATAVGVELFA